MGLTLHRKLPLTRSYTLSTEKCGYQEDRDVAASGAYVITNNIVPKAVFLGRGLYPIIFGNCNDSNTQNRFLVAD
ncbi:MAG: hypothetical protein U7127_01655 [Phormidium sp.]